MLADTRTDEADLMARACVGDCDAFSALVCRYQTPVYRACCRYLRAVDAQDAAQETFVRAFVHRSRIDPNRPILPWLLTIARNLCLDRLRKKSPEPEADIALRPDPSETRDPARSAEASEEMTALAAALAALPEGQREAIVRFHLDNMSYQDIAESLEVPVGTIMTWIHRGRARLRQLVKGATLPELAAGGGQP